MQTSMYSDFAALRIFNVLDKLNLSHEYYEKLT